MSNKIDLQNYRTSERIYDSPANDAGNFRHEAVVVYWTFYNLEPPGEVSHAEYLNIPDSINEVQIFWHFKMKLVIFIFFHQAVCLELNPFQFELLQVLRPLFLSNLILKKKIRKIIRMFFKN